MNSNKKQEKSISIYVHVPFCVRKCLYCDFLSFCADTRLVEEYFEALGKEIEFSANEYCGYEVKSVFFGGGTPSYVDSKYICTALNKIKEKFSVSPNAEISIEVNPGTVTEDKLRSYFEAGINRLSIGAQSMDDDELKRLGRIHDHKTFLLTYEMARKAGFTNINIDLMSGIPKQKLDDFMKNLEEVVELKPEHISAYSLIVEEGTPFYEMELELPSEEEDRQMYHETKRFLESRGYHRYEISNYALDGTLEYGRLSTDETGITASTDHADEYEKYESYHNKVYWKRGNYLGLGLGASSMVDNVRWKNEGEIKKYIDILTDENIADVAMDNRDGADLFKQGSNNSEREFLKEVRLEAQKLSTSECMEEFMFLGLRLVKGVSVSEFERQFGQDIRDAYGDVIDKYADLGLLEVSGDYLRLTEKGLDVSNTVMADFLLD